MSLTLTTALGGSGSLAAASLYQSAPAINRLGHVTRKYGGIGMQSPQRELTLYKGLERFIFRYEPGQEEQLLDVLIEHAKGSHTNLDWFDVSLLSLKLA